jgi:hypothetical protein
MSGSRRHLPNRANEVIAAQFGTPIDVIRSALTRDERGKASGPLGAVLDILAADEGR